MFAPSSKCAAFAALLLFVGFGFGLSGCSSSSRSQSPEDLGRAQDELRSALDSWKKGDSLPQWKKRSAPADFVDADWKRGFKLLDYQIDRVEGLAGDNARGWVVLSLEEPNGKKTKREAVYEINIPKRTIARDPLY